MATMIENLKTSKNKYVRISYWIGLWTLKFIQIQPYQWYIRIAILLYILGYILPVSHRAPLQAQQSVATEHQQVCVHTNLMDEVDEWKIQRSLQLVREMGAPTIVDFFPWAYVERQEGVYDWTQTDRVMNHAQNQGIQVIARTGLVPRWARAEDTTLNQISDDRFDEFADYVAAFAERYAGIADHIIIWNEPNLAFEWGFESFAPERYVRLLQTVYDSAHRANPNVTILAGALAPTIEPDGSPYALNDLIYLERMYQAGASDYFDALAVHTYGFTESHNVPPAPDQLNFRRVELIQEIIDRYDPEAEIYITESGWNDDPRWTKAVRPSQRIAYTIGAFNWAETHSNQVNTLCLWIFRFPRPTLRYPDNFTLVTSEFQLRPIYYAVQNYARGWERNDELWLPPPSAE